MIITMIIIIIVILIEIIFTIYTHRFFCTPSSVIRHRELYIIIAADVFLCELKSKVLIIIIIIIMIVVVVIIIIEQTVIIQPSRLFSLP